MKVRQQVFAKLKGKIASFSRHKFGSSVIELCLRVYEQDIKLQIIQELTGLQKSDCSFEDLMRDNYGNFVIQKAIDEADEDTRN